MRLPLLRTAATLLCALLVGAAAAASVERPPTWVSLTPAQRQALAPLQRDWSTLETDRKQKWIEVAARFPAMPADERRRIQERMAEWARLTPTERARARIQFQEAQQLPAGERQARWQAYQSLSAEDRKSLAQQAKPAARAASAAVATSKPRIAANANAGSTKRNGVAAATVPAARPVAPAVVQAKPGATTTTLSARATPPSHSRPGMPKIAATPGFVDPATLLPRRGPQGAAVRAAAADGPPAQP
ncbi:MAG: DUF3106 domain-containing protein [Rubrivivax sp.]|nr:DUF3106 domain-containing protein [Rubrivivax sp.]